MSLYVYAIAAAPVSLAGLHGVSGEPLRIVASTDGTSHAIVGEFETPPSASAAASSFTPTSAFTSTPESTSTAASTRPPAPTAEALRAQDALVRELAARADALLPSRFGSRFDDEGALRQTLDELTPRLTRALTRVRGCEQMTIWLFRDTPLSADEQPADSPETDAGPGTRYMRRRAAEARQLPAGVDVLRAGLEPVIEGERVERARFAEALPSPVIGSIHHLIPRGSAERYRARLDEVAATAAFAASGIRLRVSGPSPAYAFAEADLS